MFCRLLFSHQSGVPYTLTMKGQQTFTWALTFALSLALCTTLPGCGSAEPEPKAKVPRKKTVAERRRARARREQRDLAHWRKRTEGILHEGVLPKTPKPSRSGVQLVRVWRRHGVTGVITVKQEHHGTREGAKLRLKELTSEGWNHWSPNPAPELAAGLAATYPEFAECPYIMQASDTRKEWDKSVGKHLSCYRTVKALETALAREFVVAFEDDYMLPCKNLEAITISEDGPYLRSLRKRCRAMGLEVTPRESLPDSPEVRKRSKSNRLHKKRVSKL